MREDHSEKAPPVPEDGGELSGDITTIGGTTIEGIKYTVHPQYWANDFIGDAMFIGDDIVES